MIGLRFERLVVQQQTTRAGRTAWVCLCDCGKVVVAEAHKLRSGKTKSCGCYNRQRVAEMSATHGDAGGAEAPEYRVWANMLARCLNRKHPNYKNYGKRGIKVCKRWSSYKNFIADVGRRPSSKHTLDRRNNDGNYTPSNCRWATWKQQAQNRRAPTSPVK